MAPNKKEEQPHTPEGKGSTTLWNVSTSGTATTYQIQKMQKNMLIYRSLNPS
jgi:hypothetical protein